MSCVNIYNTAKPAIKRHQHYKKGKDENEKYNSQYYDKSMNNRMRKTNMTESTQQHLKELGLFIRFN